MVFFVAQKVTDLDKSFASLFVYISLFRFDCLYLKHIISIHLLSNKQDHVFICISSIQFLVTHQHCMT